MATLLAVAFSAVVSASFVHEAKIPKKANTNANFEF
jgi:hypothetical protein